MLVRCIYASRATDNVKDRVLSDILEQSRRNNSRAGITGVLFFANNVFVQAIEGGRPAVSALLGKILRDDRHQNIEVLSFEEIPERRFPNWAMGQVNASTVNPGLILKYSDASELNPFSGKASTTQAFLFDLAETNSGALYRLR